MKTAKRILALLLAAALMLAVLPAAFAETPESESIPESVEPKTYTLTLQARQGAGKIDSTRIFKLYQVFVGDVTGSGDAAKITNVKYGSSWSSDKVGQAVDESVLTAWNTTLSTQKAAFLTDNAGNPYKTSGDATYNGEKGVHEFKNLPTGYYLILESTATMPGYLTYSGDVINLLGGNVEFTLKDGTITFEKKLKDINDSGTSGYTAWQDSADYDVGDEIPFKLTATLPDNYSEFTMYSMTFHDKQSDGLDFIPGSVEVKVKNLDGDREYTLDSSAYTVVTKGLTDGITFEVKVTSEPGESLAATVDGEEVRCTLGAKSEITVYYKSTLNANCVIGAAGNPNEAWVTFTNKPGQDSETGETPHDRVIVFTYKLVVNKFYKVHQSEVPGFDSYETTSEGYIHYPLSGAEFKLYKFNQKSEKEDKWDEVTLTKNDDGTMFTTERIDDGNYKLVETKAPDGYNKVDDIFFTINATHTNDNDTPPLELTDLEGSDKESGLYLETNVNAGSLTLNVENKAGNTLPSTGGMGTTIFNIVGTILVLGAGILLISKKRVAR